MFIIDHENVVEPQPGAGRGQGPGAGPEAWRSGGWSRGSEVLLPDAGAPSGLVCRSLLPLAVKLFCLLSPPLGFEPYLFIRAVTFGSAYLRIRLFIICIV